MLCYVFIHSFIHLFSSRLGAHAYKKIKTIKTSKKKIKNKIKKGLIQGTAPSLEKR